MTKVTKNIEVKKVEKVVKFQLEKGAYKANVLGTNANLKAELKSVGACRSMLLTFAKSIELPKHYKDFLSATKDNKEMYTLLDSKVRRSKKDNVSPFYVLQALHQLDKLQLLGVKLGQSVKVATAEALTA